MAKNQISTLKIERESVRIKNGIMELILHTPVTGESKGIYVTGEAATPCLFGAHLLPVEDELGLDHRQAVVQVRDVVLVGRGVALQLVPV